MSKGKPPSSNGAGPAAEPAGERLQRYLSRCGVASRRAAEELIVQGRVEVNGAIVDSLGTRVLAGHDEVRVDGERTAPPTQAYVLALHKPEGVLCSREDPEGRPLVYALLPPDPSLRSIGRLDFATEGLLLFTNDGALAERLAHPRFGIERVYEARVRGLPTPETLARLVRGVILDDGPARVLRAEVFKQTDRNAWVRLALQEGRNREVRRLLERVGHPVMRLRRIRFAGLSLTGLKPGQWRILDAREAEQLGRRGHVGGFELPPDPRARGVRTADLAGTAAGPRKRELPPRRKVATEAEGQPKPRDTAGGARDRAARERPAPARRRESPATAKAGPPRGRDRG